jgi:hypothetical protein
VRPDFDELVGTDLPPGERARLERVHELLVAAGPPPDSARAQPPIELRSRRRRGALLAIAAALATAAFALGAALVDGSSGRTVDFVESMAGTSAAPDARAELTVYDVDDAGNWPMELEVEGLPPAASGRPFELWLTRDGKPDVVCGAFSTNANGAASVPMNAPYPFDDTIGWVVVEKGSATALLST